MLFLASEDEPETKANSNKKKNKKEPKEEIKDYKAAKKHAPTRGESNSSDVPKEKKKAKKEKKKKDKKNKNKGNKDDKDEHNEANECEEKDSIKLEYDPKEKIFIGGESQTMGSMSKISEMNENSFKHSKNNKNSKNSIQESDISISDISIRENKLDMSMLISEILCEPKDYLPPLAYKKYNNLDEYLSKKKNELSAKSDQLQFERYQILEANILHNF